MGAMVYPISIVGQSPASCHHPALTRSFPASSIRCSMICLRPGKVCSSRLPLHNVILSRTALRRSLPYINTLPYSMQSSAECSKRPRGFWAFDRAGEHGPVQPPTGAGRCCSMVVVARFKPVPWGVLSSGVADPDAMAYRRGAPASTVPWCRPDHLLPRLAKQSRRARTCQAADCRNRPVPPMVGGR